MGNAKGNLYSAIEAERSEDVKKILKQNPSWANEPMTDDCI